MPALASLAAFAQAVSDFPVSDLGLVLEPAARAAAERSVAQSGLLLLGEVHGVRENPLVIRALLRALGLAGLALEWDEELAPVVRAFLAGGALADHRLLWFGDGRITAGHLAVLRERAGAGSLHLTLMDGMARGGMGGEETWSQRDEAMAGRVLAATAGLPTQVVAGNAHTPTHPDGAGPAAGRGPGRQPAGRPGDPDRLPQRPVLQRRAAPVPAAHRLAPAAPEASSPQRKPHPGAPRRHRSGRAPAVLAAAWPLRFYPGWRLRKSRVRWLNASTFS
jgi:hypothetical protein